MFRARNEKNRDVAGGRGSLFFFTHFFSLALLEFAFALIFVLRLIAGTPHGNIGSPMLAFVVHLHRHDRIGGH